jgi:hypothetical protein
VTAIRALYLRTLAVYSAVDGWNRDAALAPADDEGWRVTHGDDAFDEVLEVDRHAAVDLARTDARRRQLLAKLPAASRARRTRRNTDAPDAEAAAPEPSPASETSATRAPAAPPPSCRRKDAPGLGM